MPRPNDLTAASDVAPRHPFGVATLVYALATLTLAWPALGGGFLVNTHSDQYIAGYAFREFAAATLRAGQGFPQWNPFLFGGMPYIAAMHGDIFYPTFLLRMAMPTDLAMTWTFVIHLFLAGLFTFGFLRAWGAARTSALGFYAALTGGLAYMLSGPIAGYASPGHDGKLFVSALLPLALWMLVRGIRDGRAWAWGTFALTVGLAVLSPHPQLLQYLLLVSGAFALFLAFGDHGGGPLPRRVAMQRLGLALGAVVLGLLIGAVQFLPVREYVAWSPRAGGKGYADAVSYSMPVEELLNAFVPQFSGILEHYWGRNGIHLHSEYPGVVVLVLAGAGMFAASVRRNARLFWTATFAVSLVWTLGGNTPFYRIIYAVVPGTKFFRAPSTMMYVTMFSLAVLAALGMQRVLTAAASVSRRLLLGWAIAIVVVGVLVAPIASALALDVGQRMAAAYQNEAYTNLIVARADDNMVTLIFGALRSIAFVLATLMVFVLARRGRFSARATAWSLLALLTIDLWSIERLYWQFSPRASVLYASDPAIDSVLAAPAPGRVFAWDPLGTASPSDPVFGPSGEGRADGLMVHRIRSVTGYHGNELGRYQTLESPRTIMQESYWRHENVHFLYTTVPDSLMPLLQSQQHWSQAPTRIVGPVRNAAGSEVNLYRFPGENPAAWVAGAIVKGSDEQALATVLDGRFDGTRAAIFAPDANVSAAELHGTPTPSGVHANVTRMEPGSIDVELDAPAPAGAALVVSENYFPGWQASVDGTAAATARANYNLIGVALPAGARSIQLRFQDVAYGTGKVVTWIALLLAVAGTAAGIVAERRRLVPGS